ncbi:MAG: hypothetical protein LBG77_02840, partial [Dysgonamonadaceae bacterium]|nr:hypothetical protein [Dysgonamonadaceae bacterium]
YHIQAQDKLSYKSLESFNNDTINYLKYNFYTLRSQYEGKTIADVIKNLKLTVIEASPISLVNINEDNKSDSKPIETVGIQLIVSDEIHIDVSFDKPVNSKEYSEAITSGNGTKSFKMTTKLYNFLKDKKVKSVYTNPIALEQVKQLRKNNN